MATYGDYTLRDLIDKIMELRPIVEYITQPVDTSGTSVSVQVNVRGLNFILQRFDDSTQEWTNVSATPSSGYLFQVPLTGVTTTSRCRILAVPYGAGYLSGTYSNEFTVTRTGTQSMSAKQDMSETLEKTDLEADSQDVVDTPTKATTTTKK